MLDETTIAEAPGVRKGLAWISLVLGIFGIFTFGLGGAGAFVGILTGVAAVRKATRDPERYGGISAATAGIALNSLSLLLIVVSFLVVVFLVQPVKVEGFAMAPTLNNGDKILLAKQIDTVKRGEVVAFWFPDNPSVSFIKRVVALRVERISIDYKGAVYINGSPIAEPYNIARTQPVSEAVSRDHHQTALLLCDG